MQLLASSVEMAQSNLGSLLIEQILELLPAYHYNSKSRSFEKYRSQDVFAYVYKLSQAANVLSGSAWQLVRRKGSDEKKRLAVTATAQKHNYFVGFIRKPLTFPTACRKLGTNSEQLLKKKKLICSTTKYLVEKKVK